MNCRVIASKPTGDAMKLSTLATVTILLISAAPVLAGFDIDQATTHPEGCYGPAVASSPDGLTMLAFGAYSVVTINNVATQLVPTNPVPGEVWPQPDNMGHGGTLAICWTREGFVLAFESCYTILLYQSDLEGNWGPADYLMLEPGEVTMGIDLWGAPTDAAGPHVFMTVHVSTDPPDQDHKVLYAAGSLLGWTDLEVVAEEATQAPHPQITWSFGPAGPWPTIFYLTGNPGAVNLVHTTKDPAAGWSTPIVVPGDGFSGSSPIDGRFAVVTHQSLSRSVFGLGPQPTCPCRSIHHLGYDSVGGWAPQENLTVNHDAYDWPMWPCLGVGPSGRVHAFWFQLGSGPNLEPKFRTLEYWIKTETGWQEEGGFLDGQENGPLGEYVALDVSPTGNVVMAWTRLDSIGGVPQPRQIWIARQHEPSNVPGSGVPRSAVALSAWPNPFNPSVRLAMDVPLAGSANLDVFDVRGRLVVRLFDGFLSAGRREVDWDGNNAAGRPAPSGVYFARLETEAGRVVRKVVLAE
jgi:hypothetical protein